MLLAQILAVVIFIVMFVFIVLDHIPKHIVTLACGGLTLVLVFGVAMRSLSAIVDTLNYKSLFELSFWYSHAGGEASTTGINWSTIIFLFGMMIMVEGMAHAGFFRWFCLLLAKLANYKPIPLFIVFMIMSAFLAMFIDSITVILFLAAITIELAGLLKIDPVPMILTEIFCANLGGSATMCGDPPNIIIGTSLNYAFADFLTHTGFMALCGLVVVIAYYYLMFRKKLLTESNKSVDISQMPTPTSAIKSKRDFFVATLIFIAAVTLLITHATTGISVALIGVGISVFTLLGFYKNALELIKKVDFDELAFFLGLFIVVGGLEQTGILEIIAGLIAKVCEHNVYLMVAIIIWVSAIASSLVDNIPFSATMIPIIRALASSQGVPIDTLAWPLSMGTCVGGSATPIGASANVVGISVAQRGGYRIGWGQYCKANAPATFMVILISMIIVFVRYC